MIRINKLSYSFGKGYVFKDVSLNVEQGTILAITGQNGTGKTTLLKIISGIITDFEGSVIVENLAEKSFIPTNINNLLLPWYKVSQNLAFYESNGNQLETKDNNLIASYLSSFFPLEKINHILNKKIYELSSGQKGIIASLCAVLNRPKLLIIDELFANISPTNNEHIIRFYQDLSKKGTTIVFTVHNQNYIEQFATMEFSLDPFSNNEI